MKRIMITLCVLGFALTAKAQVGVNTTDPKATLDVVGKTTDGTIPDGIMAPRITGDELHNKDNGSNDAYGLSQKGALVYVTKAASDANLIDETINVNAIGYYYFDGNIWKAISSRDTEPWYNVATNSAATSNTQDIYQKGKVGVGTTTPNAQLDVRPNPTSTSNPGAGIIGLGTTTIAASTAGAGAIRYDTASGGVLEYSNGVVWNTLQSTVKRSIVVAKKISTQTIASFANTGYIVDWTELTDVNNNFDPATGIFTAPRDGNYTISFSFDFNYGTVIANSQVEAILVSSGGTYNDKKSVVAFPANGASQAGASISFTLKMTAGEFVRPYIWHSTGSDKTLRVGTGADDGFVNFSVVEL